MSLYHPVYGSPTFKFQAPVGGIPAMSGVTPGKALCEIVVMDADGDLAGIGEFQWVHNIVTAVVADKGERYGIASFHADGFAFFEGDDCNDQQSFGESFGDSFN